MLLLKTVITIINTDTKLESSMLKPKRMDNNMLSSTDAGIPDIGSFLQQIFLRWDPCEGLSAG